MVYWDGRAERTAGEIRVGGKEGVEGVVVVAVVVVVEDDGSWAEVEVEDHIACIEVKCTGG